MQRTVTLIALVLALLATGSAFAGGDHGCDKSAQECLNATAAKYAKHGWLGLETEKHYDAYAVKAVTPGSPAEAAGFQPGDVLVALNGVALAEENKAELKKVKKSLAVARWVGEHMLEYHVQEMVAQAN